MGLKDTAKGRSCKVPAKGRHHRWRSGGGGVQPSLWYFVPARKLTSRFAPPASDPRQVPGEVDQGHKRRLDERGVDGRGEDDASVDGRSIRARADRGPAAVPSLIAALEAADVAVAAVTVARPSLDDVYLRHTGRSYAANQESYR